MLNQKILVVSDQFSNFAIRNDIVTISTLYNLLDTNSIFAPKESKITLIPGQGLSQETIKKTINIINKNKKHKNYDLSMFHGLPKKASPKLTHKHKEENILISEPQKISHDNFSMDLLIDDRCELMRDHQTGLHIQGMILLEASRQGYISIYEKYFSIEKNKKLYFIFNNMNVEYNKFSFPLPAQINAEITEKEFKKSGSRIAMNIKIIQCRSVSATLSLEMSIVESIKISKIESKMAREVINEHINSELSNKTDSKELIYA